MREVPASLAGVEGEPTGDRFSQRSQGNSLGGVGAARAPTGWLRGFSLETVWELVGFRKPLEYLKWWDDKLCFHLTTQMREAGYRQGKGCFEAAELIWGIAGPKTAVEVFAVTDVSNMAVLELVVVLV